MKHLPRAWNRFLLFVIGLVITTIGVLVVLTPLVAQVRSVWNRWGEAAWNWYQTTANNYRINPTLSWLQVAWIAAIILVIVLMFFWIFAQGGGQTDEVASLESETTEGQVTAELSLVEEIIKRCLETDRMITSVSTSAWLVKRTPGIKIKIVAAKGADVAQIHTVTREAIGQLDSLFGRTIPVLVHVTSGWKQKRTPRTV